MATIQDPNQEQQPGQTGGNGVNAPISGTGAAGSQTASGSASGPNQNPVSPVQQNTAPQAGQGYTDVSAYLNANPTGGQQIGNSVASNLTQGYNTTMGDINTSAQNTTGLANSGYIPENTQLIQQVANNPTAAVTDPNQVSGYQAQLNDTYTGPTSWTDQTNANGTTTGGYGTLQGEVQNAQQNANLLNTPGGNNVLVQQVENQQNPGQTSAGVNSLDTLLFGGTPGAVQAAQTAAQPYANLGTYLDTQNNNINNTISGAQANAAQTSADALNAFTGANGTLTNLNNTVNQTAATDLSQAQQQQQQLQTDLANLETPGAIANQSLGIQNYNVGQLSAADQAALGINQQQWQALQSALQNAGTSQYETGHNFGASSATNDINLNNFLTQQAANSTGINAGNTANAGQYAETAAINQLLGSQAPLQTEALNPAMASEAGTYNPATINNFNYQGALTAAQNDAAQNQTAAQQQANQLTAQANAQHAASKSGPFGSIGNFLNQAKNYAINPLTVVPEELNAVKSKV
jgi:hypothetical protein